MVDGFLVGKIKEIAYQKAMRSVVAHRNCLYAGKFCLPTVYWAGIDSPGGRYCPSIGEWIEEVAKRYFRKTLLKAGYSPGIATKIFVGRGEAL